MNNQDYIRAAVELADGFSEYHLFDRDSFMGLRYQELEFSLGNDAYRQFVLDALAAQLVRQVDAIADLDDGPSICSELGGCTIIIAGDGDWDWHGGDCKAHPKDQDRTMNTIKAIVDSKVLA